MDGGRGGRAVGRMDDHSDGRTDEGTVGRGRTVGLGPRLSEGIIVRAARGQTSARARGRSAGARGYSRSSAGGDRCTWAFSVGRSVSLFFERLNYFVGNTLSAGRISSQIHEKYNENL